MKMAANETELRNPQQSELPLRAQWGQLVQELERRQRQ